MADKTTIMRAIAEAESNQHFGAAVSFSKTEPNYLKRVFPTVCYHLSLKDPSYKAYTDEFRRTDPLYWKKTSERQFEKLFVIPCTQRKILSNSRAWLIMLDGLDECRNAAEVNDRRYELDQCTIIRLVSAFVQKHPLVPLIWIIASRPEHHLTTIFSLTDIASRTLRESILIDSPESCQDVERYLRSALSSTVQQYPPHFRESEPWPSEDDVLRIARVSCGLFVFVAMLVQFIQDPYIGNPIDRFADVLSVV